MSTYHVTSILGMDTGLPLVRIQVEDGGVQEFDSTIPAAAARDLALNLLQAAEAAISDKAVFDTLTADGRVPVNQAAYLLKMVRERRAEQ